WTEVPMEPLVDDAWRGEFPVSELGRYEYTLTGWIDQFGTWRRDLAKRVEAGQDVDVDIEVGALLVEAAARRARGQPGRDLRAWGSTSCTCRRSIRSSPRSERAGTIRWSRSRTTRGARGPSARRRAGTRRCTRTWGPWRTSTGWSRRRRTSAWRSPSTWPSSA